MILVYNSCYSGARPRIGVGAFALAEGGVNDRDRRAGGVDVTQTPTGEVASVSHQTRFPPVTAPFHPDHRPQPARCAVLGIRCRLALSYATDRQLSINRFTARSTQSCHRASRELPEAR